ncbi:MAG TPA: hypothetical protein VF041_21450 [Gemmatimonadaceae bacterium]
MQDTHGVVPGSSGCAKSGDGGGRLAARRRITERGGLPGATARDVHHPSALATRIEVDARRPSKAELEGRVTDVVRERGATGAVTPMTAQPVPTRAATWTGAVRWDLVFGAGLAVVFVHAALLPLSDIDLPMHLAVGSWIARHHAVPRVEPFAWTRPGAPYFAYSWLVELGAYELLSRVGPLGPHLLHAVIVTAAVAVMVPLGRALGWRPFTTFIVAVLHFVVLTRLTPALRPQATLFALVPLSWIGAAWLERGGRRWSALALMFAASALAAASHILFPLVAAPVLLLAAGERGGVRRAAWAAAAVGAGWLCSPYALAWPAVFRLNFAPNLLFRYPTGIEEYQPGFIAAPVFGALLAVIPWAAAAGRRVDRRLAALAALWVIGLLGFAHAEKALIVWWLVSLPLVGMAAGRLPEPRRARRAWAAALAPVVVVGLMAAEHLLLGGAIRAREGGVDTRTLPGRRAETAEPAAAWLEAHARPARRARLFTTFNYGSYLTWRLPRYSASIDSRTIFPDSVAAPEAMVVRAYAGSPLGPWREADVAVVPPRYPVAAALGAAPDWVRLPAPGPLGVWARRAWWDSVRTSASSQPPVRSTARSRAASAPAG